MVKLPVDAFRRAIVDSLRKEGALVLSAPPGSGKSTQVPRFLHEDDADARIVVLQPRRIAARSLARRVAEELGEPEGGRVGYQVRFENKRSAQTRILFQTYGVAFQQAVAAPLLPHADILIFDEFHERTLEADALLAWANQLRSAREGGRPDLRVVVMSATLEEKHLIDFLDLPDALEIPARTYPVQVEHQAPRLNEHPDQQILRAVKTMAARGLEGSTLVFLPGQGEIRRAFETLGPFCREAGLQLLELHGSLSLEQQQSALAAPALHPCVVLATNVAETSLTLPGITAVIDTGLSRQSSYDAERDINTLYLGRISLHNAVQRAGRAGRTAPGICIRLWSEDDERRMPKALDPEIKRLDVSGLLLSLASLHSRLPFGGEPLWRRPDFWLNRPPSELVEKAEALLRATEAIAPEGSLTPMGAAMAGIPAHPRLARVLLEAGSCGMGAPAAAMIALLETERRPAGGVDLFAAGIDFWTDPASRRHVREIKPAYEQLLSFLPKTFPPTQPLPPDAREKMTRYWLTAYSDRVAARLPDSNAYQLQDGRKATLSAPAPGSLTEKSPAILALQLRETGGRNQARQISIPVYLPCESRWIEESFVSECEWKNVSGWDETKGRAVTEEHLLFRGLTLARRPAAKGGPDGSDGSTVNVEDLLVEKLVSGQERLTSFDDDVRQWLFRLALAREAHPEYGFPKMDHEDWTLLYHDLCRGKSSLRQLEGVSLLRALKEYIGPVQADFLEKELPLRRKLPSGRMGQFSYSENQPPELSGRIADFIGLEGRMSLLGGKIPVVFDILAPNYRTVQKTLDMTGFWKNTYPEVKKELKRRYPRHPWP